MCDNCEEKQVQTKICRCCGRELPVTEFQLHGRSKDGYTQVCNACKASKKLKEGNPKLNEFTPRELIQELKVRGYKGELHYVEVHKIVL